MQHVFSLVHLIFDAKTDAVAVRVVNNSNTLLRNVGTTTIYANEVTVPTSAKVTDHNFYRICNPSSSSSITFTPSNNSDTKSFTWANNQVKVSDLKTNGASTVHVACTKTYKFTGTPINYAYESSSNRTYVVSTSDSYLLEVWGASGGSQQTIYIGKGGYSYGILSNTKGTLYIVTGQQGYYNQTTLPYNGGGKGQHYGCSGGGATHIATRSGELTSMSGNKEDVLLVAGGAGGGDNDLGGYGGGKIGGNGAIHGDGILAPTGANIITGGGSPGQLRTAGVLYTGEKGTFGAGGASAPVELNNDWGAGGGGGYYGGGGMPGWGAGGGGCGYVNETKLTDGDTIGGNKSVPIPTSNNTETGHSGNGYACITKLSF